METFITLSFIALVDFLIFWFYKNNEQKIRLLFLLIFSYLILYFIRYLSFLSDKKQLFAVLLTSCVASIVFYFVVIFSKHRISKQINTVFKIHLGRHHFDRIFFYYFTLLIIFQLFFTITFFSKF
jgi:hypothetical protein